MKTIIEMAGEAGIFNGDGDWSSCREEYEGVVQRFAELVRADEREACAEVCEEEICNCCWDEEAGAVAEHLAATIRARGNT